MKQPHATVELLGLMPRKGTALSSGFGLFIRDRAFAATDENATPAEREQARATLREVCRIAQRGAVLVKLWRKQHEVKRAARKAAPVVVA